MQVGYPFVHKLQEDLKVLLSGPIEDHNEGTVGRVGEQLVEMGGAGGQHKTMSFECLAWNNIIIIIDTVIISVIIVVRQLVKIGGLGDHRALKVEPATS